MISSHALSPRLLVLLTFTATLFCGISASHAAGIQPADGQPLPNMRWQDGEEQTHQLQDSHGQARILHFWAAWCVPCRQEMPALLQWQAAHPEIKVIFLSLDQRLAQTKYFIKKYQLAMTPLLLNKDDSEALGIPALPYTLFVSRDGRLLARHYGMAPWGEAGFSAQVTNLFAATP